MGRTGLWLAYAGLAAPLAGLWFICLHKMADKLFTCKYKLRAREAGSAFLELPAIPILCASHSKKQPGLSLDFSAKGTELLAKFTFNPKLLGAPSRIQNTILGDRMWVQNQHSYLEEKVVSSCFKFLFMAKETKPKLLHPWERQLKLSLEENQPPQFPLPAFCQSRMQWLEEMWFYLFSKDTQSLERK